MSRRKQWLLSLQICRHLVGTGYTCTGVRRCLPPILAASQEGLLSKLQYLAVNNQSPIWSRSLSTVPDSNKSNSDQAKVNGQGAAHGADSKTPNVEAAGRHEAGAQKDASTQTQSRQKVEETQYDSLEITDEKMSALTDKIPQRPVGVVEGTSYTLIILAAFGVLLFFIYQFVLNFILEPTALRCFNHTLDKLKADPRITVRLGATDDIRAWGSNAQTRVGRQQVPHQIYKDANGVEHVRLQFHMRGPGGTALVNADMYKDELGGWQYMYLLVDVYASGSSSPQRVHIVSPR